MFDFTAAADRKSLKPIGHYTESCTSARDAGVLIGADSNVAVVTVEADLADVVAVVPVAALLI